MAIKYKLAKETQKLSPTDVDAVIQYIIGSNVQLVIPFIEENSDYQEYLKWVAEGNTPEPADED